MLAPLPRSAPSRALRRSDRHRLGASWAALWLETAPETVREWDGRPTGQASACMRGCPDARHVTLATSMVGTFAFPTLRA